MRRTITKLGACLAAALFALAPAALAQIEAIAQARHDLNLSFTLAGRLGEAHVQPGDEVTAGQPLLRLEDQESRAQIQLLRLRAESSLEIEAAEADYAMAQVDEQRVKDAFTRNAAARFEVERAELDTKRALLALELFRQRKQEAEHQLNQAEILHQRYTLRSPVDGTVEEVLIEVGESTEALRPVLRLVVTNPLHIEVNAPTAETMRLKVGAPVWLRFRLPDWRGYAEGRIVHIAAVADAASETRLVRVETPNPDDLPAGCYVEVHFERPEGAVAQSEQ